MTQHRVLLVTRAGVAILLTLLSACAREKRFVPDPIEGSGQGSGDGGSIDNGTADVAPDDASLFDGYMHIDLVSVEESSDSDTDLGKTEDRSPTDASIGGLVDANTNGAPRCGNGVVEQGESCDDNNVIDGDGCSSTCRYDDDPTTPGDDRPGFIACGIITCASGDACCTWDLSCRGPAPYCDGPMVPGDECDGKEDCAQNLGCFATKYGRFCTSFQVGTTFAVVCHRDVDCAFVMCTGGTVFCSICKMSPQGTWGACSSAS